MSRASAVALAFGLVSCGSPPPGSVDEETLLVDLDACIRGDIRCEKSGSITAVRALQDETSAIRMTGSASISLPLQQNNGRKLVYVALGVRSEGVDRQLAVTVTGAPGAVAIPTWGWARVEVSQGGEFIPAADARLTLITRGGTFDVLWVVGRWKRE